MATNMTVEQEATAMLAQVGATRGNATVAMFCRGCKHRRRTVTVEGYTEQGVVALEVTPAWKFEGAEMRPSHIMCRRWEPNHESVLLGADALKAWEAIVNRLTCANGVEYANICPHCCTHE